MRVHRLSAEAFERHDGQGLRLGDVLEVVAPDGRVTKHVLLWRCEGRPLGFMECPDWPLPLASVLGVGSGP